MKSLVTLVLLLSAAVVAVVPAAEAERVRGCLDGDPWNGYNDCVLADQVPQPQCFPLYQYFRECEDPPQ